MSAPVPHNEALRLAELHDLAILDTLPDPSLDGIVGLAASILNVPIALISLVDAERQWFKAKIGLDACETDRESAFCAHAILDDSPLLVENALEDPRFANNPLVLGDLGIRAYFGFPLIVSAGLRLGTLCAIDQVPRTITPAQIEQMQALAKIVVRQMENTRSTRDALALAEANEVLNREADHARVILETMSEGVLIKNRQGQIVEANPSACRILGLSRETLLQTTLNDPVWRRLREDGTAFLPHEIPAAEVMRTGVPVSNVVVGLPQNDGSCRWLHLSASPLFEPFDNRPAYVVSTFSDITHLKAQQEHLKELSVKANEANDAKTQFLANMSHELRTPLNGVVGVASALANTALDARQKRMVELIRSSGKDLERQLSDILDLTKVEVGELQLESVNLDIGQLVQEVSGLMSEACAQKQLDLRFHNALPPQRTFVGDPGRIRQIVTNLVSNAVKFTAQGYVQINVLPATAGAGVVIEVKDTGIGFDETQASRLFERFSQADNSITRRFGGTGLGLAISKSLAELMGGTITAQSTPKTGSTFTLSLPLASASLIQTDPHCDDLAEICQGIPRDLRILLVEDQVLNQQVFGFMMEPFGAEFFTALHGVEGIEAFETAKFDVIFMDMQMPVKDGLATTREIRALETARKAIRTPIIMLTANAGENHRREALAAGADMHLVKPVSQAAIGDALRAALAIAPRDAHKRTSR
ncbi:autoinducer 2 sensor kinase/phosphatase LuxQ [Candidatus Phycosocius bacilliformis]|uniref:histidine kinase n=1 Tax=Candidatus Phycosocius bacilliformis TaxID=1445552 RepID=A0A2P2EC40_9PROT|nr:ATP-binding protein [Candidatus Phycosocius bacilliformis]GBF58601.1 autoinducer 2 sensor kinase/phosphatase LuxQ [Candidatus Phycosocius bacilliformis]